MDTNDLTIIDEGHERRYYATIPNLIDDLELSPYAVRLYLRLKRRAGETGICFETTGGLAKGCGMSAGMVTKAKKELVEAGLIRIEERPKTSQMVGLKNGHNVYITDIWKRNIEHYSPHEQLTIHHMNSNYSPGEIKNNSCNESNMNKNGQAHAAPASLPPPAKNAGGVVSHNHPAIQAFKQVAGFYPRKNLRNRVVDILGEPSQEEIAKLQYAFDTWTANGHNPINIKGWFFDWYRENLHYVPDSQKLPQEANP